MKKACWERRDLPYRKYSLPCARARGGGGGGGQACRVVCEILRNSEGMSLNPCKRKTCILAQLRTCMHGHAHAHHASMQASAHVVEVRLKLILYVERYRYTNM